MFGAYPWSSMTSPANASPLEARLSIAAIFLDV
jgi:hypothetical protein